MKQILATKELSVNIGGIVYDALLIPREKFVNVDYRNFPEDDPRVKALIQKVREEYES